MSKLDKRHIWLIFFLIYGAFSLADFLQHFYTPFARPPQNWVYELILFELFFWAPIALITPVIFWLVHRFPIEKKQRARHLPVYLIVSVVHTLIYAFMLLCYQRLHADLPAPVAAASLQQQYVAVLSRLATISLFDFFAIVAFVHAIRYYMQLRDREKETAVLQLQTAELQIQLARAQLQTLRMQLHPHFLFNTLHSIAGLVREDRKTEAINMISGFGDLLRQTLQQEGVQEATVQDELEFVGKYLQIEQFRFQDRLTIRTNVEPETLGAKVPYLILQPLVENAVRHGIAKKASASLVEINAFHRSGKLKLQIRDDGPGLHGNGHAGIGISNVEARLNSIYGARQSFSLQNHPGGGAIASVTIPFTGDAPSIESELSR